MHKHDAQTQSRAHAAYLRALIYSIDNNTQRNMRALRANGLYLMCFTHLIASQQAALLSINGTSERFIPRVQRSHQTQLKEKHKVIYVLSLSECDVLTFHWWYAANLRRFRVSVKISSQAVFSIMVSWRKWFWRSHKVQRMTNYWNLLFT